MRIALVSLFALAACHDPGSCDAPSAPAHLEEGYCDQSGQAFCLSVDPIPF
jgi:hypothetical protein